MPIRKKKERLTSAKKDAKLANQTFIVIFTYNITPLRFPNKSAGAQMEYFICRTTARTPEGAKAYINKEFGVNLIIAVLQGSHSVVTGNGYLVESLAEARKLFPVITKE